jgi:hypothetical protein
MILQPLTGPIWENKAQTRSSDTEASKFPTYLETGKVHVLNLMNITSTYFYIYNCTDSNKHSVAAYHTMEICTYKVLGWLSSLIIWKQTNTCKKRFRMHFIFKKSAYFSYKPALRSYSAPPHKHKHKRIVQYVPLCACVFHGIMGINFRATWSIANYCRPFDADDV